MDPEQILFALVFTIGMFAGVLVLYLAMRQRSEQMQMLHRERMAMIERGQVPLDPPRHHAAVPAGGGQAGVRSITLGIIVIAIGLGLMSIVAIAADEPSVGVGLGGAIMVLGAAFVVTGIFKRNQSVGQSSSPAPSPLRDRSEN